MALILSQTLKQEGTVKMNQNLLCFILEIIYPKKIKNDAYVINLDEYVDVGTHWIALFCRNEIVYFDSFGVDHVPEFLK